MDHMRPSTARPKWPVCLAAGLAAGTAIAWVDNVAFEGEVSPITIVAMVLAVTGAAGALWGRRSWVTAAAVAACVPMAHVVKRVLGLPDTLQPNTYASILLLAVFTSAIATVGTGLGVIGHKLVAGRARRDSGSA